MTSRRERLDRLAEGLNDHQPQPGWIEEAICPQTDPEIFFPEKGSSSRQALKVCASCPVKLDCLTTALHSPYGAIGIWGGTTPDERKSLRRRIERTSPTLTPGKIKNRVRDGKILMMYHDGMSAIEIGQQLDVSSRTVHRVVARAQDLDPDKLSA